MRTKKLPKLDKMMTRRRKAKRQSWQEMKAAVMSINAAHGGTFRKKS